MQGFFKSRPAFTEVSSERIFYNLGCLFDIPSGKYVKGLKGENIMLGGLPPIVGIVGGPNRFKSTMSRFMTAAGSSRFYESGYMPYVNTYDTEMTVSPDRIDNFAKKIPAYKDISVVDSGIWSITDKTYHSGNAWYKLLKEFLKNDKLKNKKDYTLKTPFADKEGKPIYTLAPTFGEVDSFSEFETSDIEEIQTKNELGESGGNTIHMRLGLAKTRLLMELPSICNSSGHYLIMTAHIGESIPMQQGPYAIPTKKLQHMKMGEKIKGVTDKFFFLPNLVWQTMSASLLINKDTKGILYPKTRGEDDIGSKDLNIVTLTLLRNKSGPTGSSIDIVVSQSDGVLPSLSEFQYIKENGRYGLEGNNTTYNLALYPSENLGRTTVREKLDNDPKLARAVKITADMLQIKTFYKTIPFEVPEPKDLYEKLKQKYDWDVLLNTRDYWTFNQYDHPVPFLSTYDLLEMYYDLYVPYWYASVKSK